ncbi:hypothetical protein LJM46_004677 [Escherichia coli]|uniref:hypothetical protein n=1 Tax=Enterobacteriaceae TaxID=543 RepID=UPI0009EB3CEE|nr:MULTISPECIES: hypothetical protein [Enterobacteriaceae]EBQ5245236.1 hypothetical protein [Salmonella enterica subsp. salamae]EBV4421851.1 hypothetical protein [Salmonella enterica subsp. enterica serovar Napoli]EBW3317724.1 hypothetical protein [Salmonella enterica subsp. enterica serovar Kottbus]ECF6943225.1 hypothetical protein [Salmonella enterica subsp. enterica]EDB1684732.1 hypothetical protein [Salmonella enterica subsp. enterica serovar Muenchen]
MNYNELTTLTDEQIQYYMREAYKFDSPSEAYLVQGYCAYAFGAYQLWVAAARKMALNHKTKGVEMMIKVNKQCEKFEKMMDKTHIPAIKHLNENI